MAEVGDRVEVQSKAGVRMGRVTRVSGAMVSVEWDTGGQTTVIPAPGVMSVVSGGRPAKAPAAKKAPVKKAPPAKKAPVKKAPVKKAPPAKKAPAKKAPVKKAAPAKQRKGTAKKTAAKKKRR
ncbi:MAG: hypothetical protein JO050_07210 [Acidimicrobiia bacterium]|nr:hypothetical protein [Acidimicrobiia bacterium]